MPCLGSHRSFATLCSLTLHTGISTLWKLCFCLCLVWTNAVKKLETKCIRLQTFNLGSQDSPYRTLGLVTKSLSVFSTGYHLVVNITCAVHQFISTTKTNNKIIWPTSGLNAHLYLSGFIAVISSNKLFQIYSRSTVTLRFRKTRCFCVTLSWMCPLMYPKMEQQTLLKVLQEW